MVANQQIGQYPYAVLEVGITGRSRGGIHCELLDLSVGAGEVPRWKEGVAEGVNYRASVGPRQEDRGRDLIS